jgi:hypothetical protein
MGTRGVLTTFGLGARLIVTGITFTGIPSAFLSGTHQMGILQMLGLPSGAAFGTLTFASIKPTGIASAQAIGTLTLTITGEAESHVLVFDVVCDLCTEVVE